MKDILLKDWGWIRFLRLLFGLYMLYKGYVDGQMIYYLISGVMLYQVVFNIKCLTGTCPTAPESTTKPESIKND